MAETTTVLEHGATSGTDDLVVDDDLLVEDVSIDGMCGVY